MEWKRKCFVWLTTYLQVFSHFPSKSKKLSCLAMMRRLRFVLRKIYMRSHPINSQQGSKSRASKAAPQNSNNFFLLEIFLFYIFCSCLLLDDWLFLGYFAAGWFRFDFGNLHLWTEVNSRNCNPGGVCSIRDQSDYLTNVILSGFGEFEVAKYSESDFGSELPSTYLHWFFCLWKVLVSSSRQVLAVNFSEATI